MAIEMIGIDHSVAEIDIRMIFSFTKKSTKELLAYMKTIPGVAGCVLLSTCNRMELWVSAGEDWQGNLYGHLCRVRKIPPEIYRKYFVIRKERDAVEHLFRLAGGLESRILGEDQILTQVGDALAFARENYATDHVLETLFRHAVTAAKRVKTEVALTAADPSVVHTAIRQLKMDGYSFEGKTCLVIGNGVMGKLAATLLKEEGADVTVTVRQYRSGVVEIPRACKRIDYGKRMDVFSQCDFVFSATLSPNYTLTQELVKANQKKEMVLVDLAVPRDIDPKVRELRGICLYDIDSFRKEAHSEEQKQSIREAEQLQLEEMDDFFAWYECVDMIPLMGSLKKAVAENLVPRLNHELRALPISDAERDRLRMEIGAAAERTFNKMLFGLRDGLNQSTFRECLDCLANIYEPDRKHS